jgi:transcriptional regulator with XRE-family HTH domain
MNRHVGMEQLRGRLAGRPAGEEQELFSRIAAEVAKRRQDWSLSQRELAELCGTTQSAIARLERGSRPPRIDTLWRIANVLDCDLRVELRPRTETKSGSAGRSKTEGDRDG